MNYQDIQLSQQGATTVITLNRPEKLNAYTVRMGEEIVDAFESLRQNERCRVIIITGAGRGFCAGVDLDKLKGDPAPEDADLPPLGSERLVKDFADTLFNYPKPVIAAINGAAIGVGVTLSLPCDIRIASDKAKLGIPFAKLGIVPGLGSTWLLSRLMGPGRAKLLALTGRTLSASEAAEYGLVDCVVSADSLLDTALKLADEIAQSKPGIISLIKEAMNAGLGANSIRESMEYEHAQNARR